MVFYPGERFGEYEVVQVGPIMLHYRVYGKRKRWQTQISQFVEWMELQGHFRKRCNGAK